MNAGKIEQVGSALDLYTRPNTTFVAGFIGSPPINLFCPCNDAFAAPEEVDLIGIRPENLYPSNAGLLATVDQIEPMGRETLITASTVLGPLRFLESVSNTTLNRGDQIHLSAQPGSAILFDNDGYRVNGSIEIGQPNA